MFWDIDLDRPVREIVVGAHLGNVETLGRQLAPQHHSYCAVLDVQLTPAEQLSLTTHLSSRRPAEPPQVVATCGQHTDTVTTIVWTSDERQIVTGSKDAALGLWNFYLAQDSSTKPTAQ